MNFKKVIVRIVAILMLAALALSSVGCVNSYNTNPVVAKVGKTKLRLNEFLNYYQNSSNPYYQYFQYGIIDRQQYGNMILDELINYGVQLEQARILGLKLTDEEEAEIQSKVDNDIKQTVIQQYSSKVDSNITDADARYAACLKLFKKDLRTNGKTSFNKYRSELVQNYRNSALIDKLRSNTVGDIKANNNDLKAYYKETVNTRVTVSDFNTGFKNFITGSTLSLPLYMPHPERGVKDDPETEENEATASNDYAKIFSVKHILFKYKDEAPSTMSDYEAYAAEDPDFVKKMNSFETELPKLTLEQFLEKCYDSEFNEDPGMSQPCFQYFGYMMQEGLLDSYYPGFGYAAMKLYFGEGWEPKAKTTDESSESSDTESKDEVTQVYSIRKFRLADGNAVMKVYTGSGAHYIIINENNDECFSMYDNDGYLIVPLFDGDEPVKEGRMIATANGTMSSTRLASLNEVYSHIGTSGSDGEKSKTVTSKDVYEYFLGQKTDSLQSAAYAEVFTGWKNSFKVTVNNSILSPYIKN